MSGLAAAPIRAARQPLVQLLACALLLNLALTFDNDWPGLGVLPRADLSIEAVLLVLVTVVAGRRLTGSGAARPDAVAPAADASMADASPAVDARARRRRLLRRLTAITWLLVLGRYVQVTVPALFGRPIDLFWDVPHIPDLIASAASRLSWGQLLWPLVAIAAIVAVSWRGVRLLLAGLLDAGARLPPRLAQATVLACALTACAAGSWLALAGDTAAKPLAQPVALAWWHQLDRLRLEMSADGPGHRLPASPVFDGDLGALGGADVLLVFFESYGVVNFDDPGFAAALRPARDALGQAIAGSGRAVVSARVTSPTFAGGSWLAHADLLAGIDMLPERHHLLLATSRPTLVQYFHRSGYRTVALLPGIRQQWPEGAFYGYDQIYDAPSLQYRGPKYGFWEIPDQFSMARLDAMELGPGPRAPRLVVFPTISSHIPFSPVPAFRPDWSGFDEAQGSVPAPPTDWTRLAPGYQQAVAYTYRWLGSYLARHPAPSHDLLMIVIGDHQPAASVSGPHASWDVPVHVIASRPALLRRFMEAGFVAGLTPPTTTWGPMHRLTPLLIQAFSADGALPAAAARASPPLTGSPPPDAARRAPAAS